MFLFYNIIIRVYAFIYYALEIFARDLHIGDEDSSDEEDIPAIVSASVNKMVESKSSHDLAPPSF